VSKSQTIVSIDGDQFLINGEPTYKGRTYRGWKIEGLLLNSRMANAVFDDINPLTRQLWAYPDTGEWDAERNVNELIDMLPTYAALGLLCIPVNFQGASPLGYYRTDAETLNELSERIKSTHTSASENEIWKGLPGTGTQPWDSGAFETDGSLREPWMERTARIIEAADANGMVVNLGLFYFGQDGRLTDEGAVIRAVDNSVEWVLAHGFKNIIIEINNEANVPRYEHEILTPPRVHELIERVVGTSKGGEHLLVGTSFAHMTAPTDEVIRASDFILLHGNSMHDPKRVGARIDDVRASAAYTPKPILYNEDDHFEFDQPMNNFTVALSGYASWGYFDPGEGAGGSAAYGDYVDGYQNPPINWGLNTERKQGFFRLLSDITGVTGMSPPAE
jgi:hypothetical protein